MLNVGVNQEELSSVPSLSGYAGVNRKWREGSDVILMSAGSYGNDDPMGSNIVLQLQFE